MWEGCLSKYRFSRIFRPSAPTPILRPLCGGAMHADICNVCGENVTGGVAEYRLHPRHWQCSPAAADTPILLFVQCTFCFLWCGAQYTQQHNIHETQRPNIHDNMHYNTHDSPIYTTISLLLALFCCRTAELHHHPMLLLLILFFCCKLRRYASSKLQPGWKTSSPYL